MHIRFNYPHKIRTDFLHDVVKQLVTRRQQLGITQDELNHTLGVADRLVSHWECGVRSPTAFHLYCWADALKSKINITANDYGPPTISDEMEKAVNDNILFNVHDCLEDL